MGRHHVAMRSPHLYTSYPSLSGPFNTIKPGYPPSTNSFRDSSVSTLGLVVGDRIPGLKISAAFLTSLQSNLFIELDSAYDSADETPAILPRPSPRLQPSPLAHAMSAPHSDFAPPEALRIPEPRFDDESEAKKSTEPTLAEDGLPILKSFSATDDDMRAEALHIIADSVAQQRNLAARAIIFHPITLAIFAASFAAVYKQFWTGDKWDWLKIGTTMIGVVMAILGGVRLVCGPYIFEAERIGTWSWLNQGRSAAAEEEFGVRVLGESDEVLLTKFGEEYIGAIIFRGVQPKSPSTPSGNKRTRRAQSPSKHTKMVIRAWSVAQKYRRKEVGTALLDDALKIGINKGWTADGVEFALDHANAKRVLPAIFNGPMDKYPKIAERSLEKRFEALTSTEKGRKKR